MKRSLLLSLAFLAAAVFAVQLSLPPALSQHVAKLKAAPGLKVKATVNLVGGSPVTVEVTYGKEGMMCLETPTELTVSDGKTITVLDKGKNSYSQEPFEKAALLAKALEPGLWGWASFVEEDPAKLFKAARASAPTKLRGVAVTPVEATQADGKATGTLYIETKTGVARGFQYVAGEKTYIVWAETVEVLASAPEASTFVFVAPAGATKVEAGTVASPTWKDVSSIFTRKCMPCHSSQQRSGTLDLTSYDAVANNRFVVKGEATNSVLARALRAGGAKRMPQGRPPLPESEIKTIEAWINGGLQR